MVQTANINETEQSLQSKIISTYDYLTEHEDAQNAGKVKELAKKLKSKEFLIAFCGHFSAGKSTMINKLIGENLLPSSPIPTSANLVKVKTGEDYAKVIFKNEKPRMYLAPYDYELVKNYCKDGDQIEEIEISHQNSPLPKNTVIMDTPGIDSADDAHRIATESAIHLADLIFYIMDYNHVQAELNFQFTKELTQAGKEVYLVINQIDKHNPDELGFTEFQKSVVESFASWGVKPARIFYTTLKSPDHPYNQFSELKQFISEKLASKDQILLPSIFHSLKKITQDHIERARTNEESELQQKIEVLSELDVEEREKLIDTYSSLEDTLKGLSNNAKDAETKFDEQVAQILKNAYLMPFQTRELAKEFLESCQPEFKVGFLFSKQKTEQERLARLERFHLDILDKVKSQVEWHLKEFLRTTLKENRLDEGELLSQAQAFSVEISEALLTSAVKSGARMSGEYVLNYTDEVAIQIKRVTRQKLESFKSAFLQTLTEASAKRKEKFEKEYAGLTQYITALQELKAFSDKFEQLEKDVNLLLINSDMKEDQNHLFEDEEEEYEVVKGSIVVQKEVKKAAPVLPELETIEPPQILKKETGSGQLKNTARLLKNAAVLIKDLPGFQKLAGELSGKAERLEQKGFTVALFGAFSAGKSSFANALMGEKVLPVSPNPTTAAINKIKPVTPEHPHGTVLVKFKEKAAMLEDVNRSLKVFDFHAKEFDQAKGLVGKIMQQDAQEGLNEKVHYAFLNAFNKGFDTFVNQLGTIIRSDMAEFQEFVALEEKSCYVEWIELYYDCELTRKGITLVDTPGADSINARHTGVAFDYIKNSDAILFVTYYNHAFSKADREFLIQLGRVKDSFQMDKMFFIINAIDLAGDEEEKDMVAAYVKDQLTKYGIRNPHLNSLSSLLALQEKMGHHIGQESGMASFENAFYQFISNDLTEMAISSAENELQRTGDLVEKLIQSAQEDVSVKEKRRKEIESEKAKIRTVLSQQSDEQIKERLYQEANELVYYIKQRVFLRFGDFFKESFNPSTLRDDGRNLRKAFQAAFDEFLESFGFDFAQELRATTVRLDRYTEKALSDYQEALTRNVQEINGNLSFSKLEFSANQEIAFAPAFNHLDLKLFTKALSYFKNPKSFFEKNEKKFMSEELERVLQIPTDEYLKQESTRLNEHYSELVGKSFNQLLNQVAEEANEYYVSLLSALDGAVPIERLIEIQTKLKKNS